MIITFNYLCGVPRFHRLIVSLLFFVAISAAGVEVLAVSRRNLWGSWCYRGKCLMVSMSKWRAVGERGGSCPVTRTRFRICVCVQKEGGDRVGVRKVSTFTMREGKQESRRGRERWKPLNCL